MKNWESFLKADPTDWLLEPDNPSVRYFMLTQILDRPPDDPETAEAKAQIMTAGVVPLILAKQEPGGYWGVPADFYIRSKYRGTVWNMIVLAEMGADGNNPGVRAACKFILENSQDKQSGGFAYYGTKQGGGHGGVIPCLTGNMARSLLRFGYMQDERVQRAIDWITTYQRFDDGDGEKPQGWPYDGRYRCFGRHTCHMGVVAALKALAEIPPEQRTEAVNRTIRTGAEHMLRHHVHKRSHNPSRVAKPAWLNFGFPNMWQIDALEILGLLTGLGYKDQRMQEAVDLVVSKQDEQGRWTLETTFNGRFLVNIEQKGEPSKWITLRAMRALKGYYGA